MASHVNLICTKLQSKYQLPYLNYRNNTSLYLFIPWLQVQMDVNVRFVQDILKGDNQTEIRVKFIKRLEDALPAGEE